MTNQTEVNNTVLLQEKREGKKLFKHTLCGMYRQEWFLPGLGCVPLISSGAAKVSLKLCVRSGALDFKLIEEPGQRDGGYTNGPQLHNRTTNDEGSSCKTPKKFLCNSRKETSERGTTLVFKYIKGSSREEGNLLSSTSIAKRSRNGIKR